MGRAIRRLLRVMPLLATAGVLGIGLLLAALWFEHDSALELPIPTGTYSAPLVTGARFEVK